MTERQLEVVGLQLARLREVDETLDPAAISRSSLSRVAHGSCRPGARRQAPSRHYPIAVTKRS